MGSQTDISWVPHVTLVKPKTAAKMTKVDTYERVYDKSIAGYKYKDIDSNKKGIQHKKYQRQAILFYKE